MKAKTVMVTPLRKPEPHDRVKRRKKAQESAVKIAVRAQCVARDGYCRLAHAGLGACHGPSEWAHLRSHRRSKTVGQAPERRHTTVGSMMLCCQHHARFDGKALPFISAVPGTTVPMGPVGEGADGHLKFISEDGAIYDEGEVG